MKFSEVGRELKGLIQLEWTCQESVECLKKVSQTKLDGDIEWDFCDTKTLGKAVAHNFSELRLES